MKIVTENPDGTLNVTVPVPLARGLETPETIEDAAARVAGELGLDAPVTKGAAEFPLDRWFRDAWVFPAGGGPVTVDLEKAKLVQADKIAAALALKAPADSPEMDALTAAIAAARNPAELKAVWPAELSLVKA